MTKLFLSRNTFLIILTIIYLSYGIGIALFSNPGFPKGMKTNSVMPFLSDKPVCEDGFYMLTVAWNMAMGNGITYNYNKQTTGIQPLGTIVYAGLAWIVQSLDGNKWTFVRLVLFFGCVNLLIFAYLLGLLTRELLPGGVGDKEFIFSLAFIATLFNFSNYRLFTNGLETGIYLNLLCICIIYTIKSSKYEHFGVIHAITLGFIGGLTCWGRIDFGIVFLVFLAFSLLDRKLTFMWCVTSGITMLLVISPWFAWVYSVSGKWLPSSGDAVSGLIDGTDALMRVCSVIGSIIDHATPWVYFPGFEVNRLLSIIAIFSVIGFLTWIGKKKLAIVFNLFSNWPIYSWFAGFISLIIVYIVLFKTDCFYNRYSAPIMIVFIPAIVVSVVLKTANKSQIYQKMLILILPICFFSWAFCSLHLGRHYSIHSIPAGFVKKEFNQDIKIGAFQSGVIGFFSQNVVNLDGKIDFEALKYFKKHQIDRYIDNENISVIIDWPEVIAGYIDSKYLNDKWKLYEKVVPTGSSICYVRKDSTAR
jgi:hypothetical protein